jgi:predicted RNase H-like HicB family nuclease
MAEGKPVHPWDYPVLLFHEPEDGSWTALVPDLPGCVAGAPVRADTIRSIWVAINAWLDDAGDDAPPPSDGHELAERLRATAERGRERFAAMTKIKEDLPAGRITAEEAGVLAAAQQADVSSP